MTPAISIVLPIWINLRDDREWERDLNNTLTMLDAQSLPPHEVLVVDLNTREECIDTVKKVTGAHLATRIPAPQDKLNMSHGLNVGIKQATGDYIACIGYEMLLSVGYLKEVAVWIAPQVHLGGTCGFLPQDVDLSDPLADWNTLITPMECRPAPGRQDNTYRSTIGALQVMHRDQWFAMRGYNEELPFARTDSELIRAVKKAGLKQRRICWEQAQMLHPWHKHPGSLLKHLGGLVNLDAIKERNARGWGEL